MHADTIIYPCRDGLFFFLRFGEKESDKERLQAKRNRQKKNRYIVLGWLRNILSYLISHMYFICRRPNHTMTAVCRNERAGFVSAYIPPNKPTEMRSFSVQSNPSPVNVWRGSLETPVMKVRMSPSEVSNEVNGKSALSPCKVPKST